METEPIETFGEEDMAGYGGEGSDGEEEDPLEAASIGNLPVFEPVETATMIDMEEVRRISVPRHRYGPLKNQWEDIVDPIVNVLNLEIQMNLRARKVELQNSDATTDPSALQMAADFLKAFMYGFDLDDAMALLRIPDLYIDSFAITDVKMLKGDHKSRAIGRVCGQNGVVRTTIENSLRVRIVVASDLIHILGAFENIKLARRAISSLIMGSPPGKVYGQLRAASARLRTRY